MQASSSSLSSPRSMGENQSCKDLCGKLAMRVVYDHKVRGGIALTVFVLSVIVALALVPGIMGTVGSFSSAVPVFTQITQTLGLPGVIALDAIGGGALLVALGTMVWAILEFCKSRNHFMNEEAVQEHMEKKTLYYDYDPKVIQTANNGYCVTFRPKKEMLETLDSQDLKIKVVKFATKEKAEAYAEAYRLVDDSNSVFYSSSIKSKSGLPNLKRVKDSVSKRCKGKEYGIVYAAHWVEEGDEDLVIQSHQYYAFRKKTGNALEIWPCDSQQDARERLARRLMDK